MAGWDDSKQRSFTVPGGGRGEAGKVDFSAASYCAALPTRMTSIYAWQACPGIDPTSTTDVNAFERMLTVDIADITNGNIIVKRQTARTDISATWYYQCLGW